MRKLFSLVALSMLVATSAYAKNYPTYDSYSILNAEGSREGEPTRKVVLVRYPSRDANAASISSGDALIWDTVSDDGVSVQKSEVSGDNAFAGIAATTIQSAEVAAGSAKADAGYRNWGYMVVWGPTTANVTAGGTGAHSAGDFFITSNDLAKITTMNSRAGTTDMILAEGRKLIGGRGGIFLDAVTAADTTAEVFVQTD